MRFDTSITLSGPLRAPVQLLADQSYDGHASLHDASAAGTLGLAGAPIEGPTHFSQFDPLAALVWGPRWFEQGCLSSHFRTMVIEGEQVQASLTTTDESTARIEAHKADGTPVLVGSASIGPDHAQTALESRLDAQGDPGELFVIDQIQVGMQGDDTTASLEFDENNGSLYPFSLAQKLAAITEPHPWYTREGGASSPWGRPVVPLEMLSVLTNKSGQAWPVRRPSLGLFLDLEVRLLDGPVFVGEEYRVHQEVVGRSQSKRTESYWVRSTLHRVDESAVENDRPVAAVLLHSGVFKESYAGYPAERLP